MPDLTAVARLVDEALGERVVVYGSLPHDAHDLDLLVRPKAMTALAERLPAHGFVRWRSAWVRLDGCRVAVVEPADAGSWRLPDDEAAALFADAVPLPGLDHLVRPAPRHALLIAARRAGGGLDPGSRLVARARATLVEEPHALEEARQSAEAWGCAQSLDMLADVVRTGRPPGRRAAVQAALEQQHRRGRHGPGALVRVARLHLLHRRPGGVVTLAGPDRAATRTHAEALADALDGLGYDVVVDPADAARNRRRVSSLVEWASVRRQVRGGRVLVRTVSPAPPAPVRVLPGVAPRPVAAYLLDVPAGEAPDRTTATRRLDDVEQPGLRTLDAQLSADQLCAEILADVWTRLAARSGQPIPVLALRQRRPVS